MGVVFSSSLALSSIAFICALAFSLALVPLCRKLALFVGILDQPGGRKEHSEATPLFGGLGVAVACTLSLLAVVGYERLSPDPGGLELKMGTLTFIFMGSVVIFFTGFLDDLFKDKLPFYYKLLGQILGSTAAMVVVFYANFKRLATEPDVPFADYIYLVILMGWMLTVINSFNFSDNINGLSSGLAVIALLISMVYLGSEFNIRFMVLGFILVGAILGFLPFNFPKAKVFLGDAGSMFIGYWIGIILWSLTEGFFDGKEPVFGVDNLIPPLLVMGVPLYDAAFVVFMRWREKRPVYLGDNKHLSHRLVRCGFSTAESTLILWGLALILGGMGAMSLRGEYSSRFMSLFIGISLMLIVTVLVMKKEKQAQASGEDA